MKKFLLIALAAALIAALLVFQTVRRGRVTTIVDDEYNDDICSVTGGEADVFRGRHGQTLTIYSIKHGSLALRVGCHWLYVDPVATAVAPATDYGALPKADYILITHSHPDHLDADAVATLSTERTRIIANAEGVGALLEANAEGVGALLEANTESAVLLEANAEGVGAEVLANGDRLTLGDGWTVEAVPAYNCSPDKQQFHPQGRDNGYILTVCGLRVYIAGDTEDIAELRALKDIDIAFLPCNQPFTMTPEQCARAARTMAPRVLFPYHYGDTDVQSLPTLLEGSGIDVRIRSYR